MRIGVRERPVSQARRARRLLALVSVGYFLSVWAWGLLSPLAPVLRDATGLTEIGQALVVAVPVLVGCLGRVPVGALADRFGGRVLFLAVTGVTIAALAGLAAGGYRSVPGLMAGAVVLGAAGTTFAAGLQVIGVWYPGAGRGVAVGVLGMGVLGNAAGGLTAVRWADAYGMAVPFLVCAVLLAVWAAAALLAGRRTPDRMPPVPRTAGRFGAALRLRITRRAAGWYAVQFGLFVAFSGYLPVYLRNAYGMPAADAGVWMAAFVLVAVFARPAGGWVADRYGPARPLVAALAVLATAAAVQASTPPLPVVAGLVLPALAVALGVATSATLVRVATEAGPPMVGLVSGLVTAAAGMAGFATPLLLAFSSARLGGYGPALLLLAGAAAAGAWSAARHRADA